MEQVVREEKVNEAQIELDRKCVEVIAKRQPTALSICARLSVPCRRSMISNASATRSRKSPACPAISGVERFQHLRLNEARHIGALVQDMLKEALNAFARLDVIAAAR